MRIFRTWRKLLSCSCLGYFAAAMDASNTEALYQVAFVAAGLGMLAYALAVQEGGKESSLLVLDHFVLSE